MYEVDAKYSLDFALLTLRRFEPDLVMAIELAKAIGGSGTYIDVGANAGFWAIPLAKNFSSAIAFEPDPGVRSRLIRNVSLNSLENFEVSDLAVSESSGSASFAVRRALDNSGSLNDGMGSLVNFETFLEDTLRVQTVSLDEYLATKGSSVGLIKIDVEGAEEMVLLGATQTLQAARPIVVSEMLFPLNSDPSTLLTARLNLFPKSYRHFVVEKNKLHELDNLPASKLSDLNIFSIPGEKMRNLASWIA
jgi:FkbM family methyltransferase